MGAGVLGRAVLARLRAFGFPCAAWSRMAHAIEGVECHAGEAGLGRFLARTDVLVCLLPLTPATHGLLGADLFARLPRGASLVNLGRGAHVVAADLLAAPDSGRLTEAILDVTDPEPLPEDHAFWSHPRIAITPHIASETSIPTAVDALIANIRRHRAGQSLEGLVDRKAGY
jgi:glyoxylate/hydroxypyruvate reductase A